MTSMDRNQSSAASSHAPSKLPSAAAAEEADSAAGIGVATDANAIGSGMSEEAARLRDAANDLHDGPPHFAIRGRSNGDNEDDGAGKLDENSAERGEGSPDDAVEAEPGDDADESMPLVGDSGSGDNYGDDARSTGFMARFHRFRRSKIAVVMVVSVALFTDMLIYGIVVPILPILITRYGGDSSAVGMCFAAYALGLLVATPIFGILSDRFRTRKWFMIIGLFCLAVTTVLFSFATNITQLVLARIAQGISAAASWVIGLAWMADTFGRSHDFGLIMGTVLGGNTLGYMAGPPVGGFLFQYLGERYPFFVCAGIAALDLLARLVAEDAPRQSLQDESPPIVVAINESRSSNDNSFDNSNSSSTMGANFGDNSSSRHNERSHHLMAGASSSSSQSNGALHRRRHGNGAREHSVDAAPSSIGSMLALLQNPLILTTMGVIVIASGSASALEPTLPIHLEDVFEASSATVGLVFIAVAIPGMVVAIFAGWVADRLGRKLVSALGLIGMAITGPLIAIPTTYEWLLPMVILFGTFTSVALAPTLPEMAILAPDNLGVAYSIFNFAYALGMMGGPAIGGVLYEHFAGLFFEMICFGVMCVMFSPIVLFMSRFEGNDDD